MTRRLLFLALGLGAAVYGLLCLGVWFFQERLVYFPGPPPVRDPGSAGLRHEEVRLTAADGVRLHGWFLPADGARAAVLVSHGNGGTIEHRLGLARAFVEMGFAVLLYDYRGYGASGGTPGEEGTYLDAEAAHGHLVERGFEPRRIAAFGESLGGAVSIELARRRPVGALVVESPFTSIPDMASRVYPWLPARLLARIRYDSASKIASVEAPCLVLHSPDDEIVPVEHGRRIFDLAPEPKRWVETRGGHNDGGFLLDPADRAAVRDFLVGHVLHGL